MISNPKKYTKTTSYGAARYIKNLNFDKKTGKYTDIKGKPVFDKAKVAEEEKYDGYYSIVTSELHMSENGIINTYRGLWELKDTFKVTKGVLKTRPVHV